MVITKGDGDVRVCVDVHHVNEARHLIPPVEELLQNLNKGTMFSKIDLKWVSIRLYLMRTVNTSLLLRSLL